MHHGKKAHDDDLQQVVERALEVGVTKMMVTGSDLEESKNAIKLADEFPGLCYATVGVHPCAAKSFVEYPDGPDALLQEIKKLAQESRDSGKTTAFGEFGLDYDRLFLCDKETQILYFKKCSDSMLELKKLMKDIIAEKVMTKAKANTLTLLLVI